MTWYVLQPGASSSCREEESTGSCCREQLGCTAQPHGEPMLLSLHLILNLFPWVTSMSDSH